MWLPKKRRIHSGSGEKDPENNFFIKTVCIPPDLDTPILQFWNKLKVIVTIKLLPDRLSYDWKIFYTIPHSLWILSETKSRSSGDYFSSFWRIHWNVGFISSILVIILVSSDYFNLAFTSDIYTKGVIHWILHPYTKALQVFRYTKTELCKSLTSEKELPDFSSTQDFHVNWTHSGSQAIPCRSFNATVNVGTSRYYRDTIASVKISLSNTFSFLCIQPFIPDKRNNLGISLNHTQNTISLRHPCNSSGCKFNIARIFLQKESMPFGAQRWFEKIGTSYSLRATVLFQTKDSLLFKQNSVTTCKWDTTFHFRFQLRSISQLTTLSPSMSARKMVFSETTEYAWNPELSKDWYFDINKFKAAWLSI